MEKELQSLNELTAEFTGYLRKLAYSEKGINTYRSVWRHLGHYMKANGIEHYTSIVGSTYLNETIALVDKKKLTRWQRNKIRVVTVLSDYIETGTFRKVKKRVAPKRLDGPIGAEIAKYIDHNTRKNSYTTSTVQSTRLYLSVFSTYLNESGIDKLEDFDQNAIGHFVKSLVEYSNTTRYLIIQKTNQFLKYMYDEEKLLQEHFRMIPRHHFVLQPKLPSYYSKQEVEQLLASIDRANALGKRDYAMLMLVTRLGLRCSDIAHLKYDNILWEKELIVFNQIKTKGKVELPLLQEVGTTIIDYLKYGRPGSDLPYIFLRHIPPYDNMCNGNLYGVVKKYMGLARINYDERKHGPHSLRHSLATTLLADKVTLPVISSILGHRSTESTMEYLRVDKGALINCALEVMPINTSLSTMEMEVAV